MLSVLIPTHRRADRLSACLESLRGQVEGADAEVVVALDGPDPDAVAALESAATSGWGERLRWMELEKRGYIPARVDLLREARGEIALSLNDDVTADPGLLRAHLEAHGSGEVVVAGSARWKAVEGATVFDRVVMETGMVFFEPPETGGITFRDCYGLNMSFPVGAARRVGGFWEMPGLYGYDDIELAWRLERGGCGLTLRLDAGVEHDHRYTPESVFNREFELGRAAWHVARLSPGFGRELFGELHDPAALRWMKEAVERGARDAERVRASYLRLGETPGDGVPVAALEALASGWAPLKRWQWRRGVLEEGGGV